MNQLPYMQFYVADWDRDTRHLSLAAAGGWIRILSALWTSPTRGRLTLAVVGWARVMCATVDQAQSILDELCDEDAPVCDHERRVDGKVTLISRRMWREYQAAQSHVQRQTRYRERRRGAGADPPVDAPVDADVDAPLTQENQNQNQSSSSSRGPSPQAPPGNEAATAAAVDSLEKAGMGESFAHAALVGLNPEQAVYVARRAIQDLRRYSDKHVFARPDDRGRWLTGAIRAGRSGWLVDMASEAAKVRDLESLRRQTEIERTGEAATVTARAEALGRWRILTPDRRQELATVAAVATYAHLDEKAPQRIRWVKRQASSDIPHISVLDVVIKSELNQGSKS